MISYIKGQIKGIDPDSVIILTDSGIGYEVIINELVYSQIYNQEYVELYVYHNISENGQSLFGFTSFDDRVLFKELIKIPGIGGRIAQNILSLGALRLRKAILESDKRLIGSIKGVGKRMAEKVILELSHKDIIKNIEAEDMNQKKFQSSSILGEDLSNQILSTLVKMGYDPKKVKDILANLPEGLNNNLEKIVPYVIKNM